MTNPLAALSDAGVSIWLDDLDRTRLTSGGLASLIADSHVVGVTTNPAIFDKAISSGGAAYAEQLHALAAQGADAESVVRALTTDDVRDACRLFADTYRSTGGQDGRVSIEVDPRLAFDSAATVAEAAALHDLVGEPNVLIKIPATDEGMQAITDTLGAGISVNVTLIFSTGQYDKVRDAWEAGMRLAHANGHDVTQIHSVASFFVSRVDTNVDAKLDAIGTPESADLRGKAGIANAQLAYADFLKSSASDSWAELQSWGVHVQRPLWASTGVKDPAYPPDLYVAGLVGPHCVNTMPEPTLDAVRSSEGLGEDTLSGKQSEAAQVFDELKSAGVDMEAVFEELMSEGVDKFVKSWQQLLDNVQAQIEAAR